MSVPEYQTLGQLIMLQKHLNNTAESYVKKGKEIPVEILDDIKEILERKELARIIPINNRLTALL